MKIGAPVSIGFSSLERDAISAEDRIAWHLSAHLSEVSILRLGEIPAFQGSCITRIFENLPKKPAAVIASDRASRR